MKKKAYTILGSFESCGKSMVVVEANGNATCIMTEIEYNEIIEAERRHERRYKAA